MKKRKTPLLSLLAAAVCFLPLSSTHAQAKAQTTSTPPSTVGSGSTNPAITSGFNQQEDGRRFISQSADPSYILKPNDFIQIIVFQEDELNTITRVSPEGTISFPLVGDVKIGGNNIAKATQRLRTMLMDGYIKNPQISITVMEFAKRRFSVLGEVQRPGTYEMPQQESVNILQAIALAGGYTRIANPRKITIKRVEDGKEKVYQIDAKTIAQNQNGKLFYIQPDDSITVAESLF